MTGRLVHIEDLETTKDLLKDKAVVEFQEISYFHDITPDSTPDDIHFEVEEADREFATPVTLYMWVLVQDDEKELSKYGEDRKIDLVIQIPTVLLEEASLAYMNSDADYTVDLVAGAGDRFVWSGRTYEVVVANIHDKSFFCNTGYPMQVQMLARLLRKQSTEL